jgi:hypothetical protein
VSPALPKVIWIEGGNWCDSAAAVIWAASPLPQMTICSMGPLSGLAFIKCA